MNKPKKIMLLKSPILFTFLLLFAFLFSQTDLKAESNYRVGSMIIELQGFQSDNSEAKSNFKNGSGTPEDPFLVSNAVELNAVRYHLDKHFKQIANIDLGMSPWNRGRGWEPIGDMHTRFTGSYDGGNHSIKNLTINQPLDRDLGLFGQVSGALVRNLVLENVNITGYYMLGSLAGKAIHNSRIEYVVVVNTRLNIQNRFCGGLIGNIDDASVYRCSVSGAINRGSMYDWNFTGGLFGTATSSTTGEGSLIEECYSFVKIISISHNTYGGITGALWHKGVINNSYARGSVIADNEFAGGFVGDVSLGHHVKWITNSYSTGYVRAKGNYVHGFAGRIENGSFDANFWDIETSGQTGTNFPAATGKTTKEMKSAETFENAGWDFDTIWAIDPQADYNDGYPYLQWQLVYATPKHLLKTSLNATEAVIEWSRGAVETEWELAWGYTGFDPEHDDANIASSSQNFFHLENLNPDTYYDVYVRAVYHDQYSLWTGPVSFRTKSAVDFLKESTTLNFTM